MVVPRLCYPITDICFMDQRILGKPRKRRASRFCHLTGLFLDQCQTLFVAQRLIVVTEPGHREMKYPCFRVVWTIGHAGDYVTVSKSRIPKLSNVEFHSLDWNAWNDRWLKAK